MLTVTPFQGRLHYTIALFFYNSNPYSLLPYVQCAQCGLSMGFYREDIFFDTYANAVAVGTVHGYKELSPPFIGNRHLLSYYVQITHKTPTNYSKCAVYPTAQ